MVWDSALHPRDEKGLFVETTRDAGGVLRRGHAVLSPDQGIEYGIAEMKASGLSAQRAENAAYGARAYTQDSFKEVNQALRSGDAAKVGGDVKALDDFIAHTPKYPGDQRLYRGVALPAADAAKLVPGAVFSDKAYASTSSDMKSSLSFIGPRADPAGKTQVLIQIQGHRSGVSVSHITGAKGEGEVLFARGTRFRVEKVSEVNYMGAKVRNVLVSEAAG